VSLSYNTISGQGDCLVQADGNYGDSTSEVDIYDNVLLGQTKWADSSQKSCLFYWSQPPLGRVAIQGNVIWNTRYYTTNPSNNTYADPKLVSENLASLNPSLAIGSPAIDKASTMITVKTDYAGNARPVGAGYDIGSYEYGSSPIVPPPPPTRKWHTGGAEPARLIGATGAASEPARRVSSSGTTARTVSTAPEQQHSLGAAFRRWLSGAEATLR